MGNTHTIVNHGQHDIHSFLQSDISQSFKVNQVMLFLKNSMNNSNFLRSTRCDDINGSYVVKIYFKESDTQDLTDYYNRFIQQKEIFDIKTSPNVIPFSVILFTILVCHKK